MTLPGAMASTPIIHHTPFPRPTPFGMLFRIPPELRLMIYRQLLLQKSVRFLETSKAIHSEAIEVLLKEGVCRLEFNDYRPLDINLRPDWSRNTIMNFEIRLILNFPYMSNGCISRFNEWMTVFLHRVYRSEHLEPRHKSIPRKSCKIVIDCGKNLFPFLPRRTFNLIRLMNGFEVLTLAIADDDPTESEAGINDRLCDLEPDPLRRIELAMHSQPSEYTKYVYGLAEKALRPTLGAGELICDGKEAHLEFHPRDYDSVRSRRKMYEFVARWSRSSQFLEQSTQCTCKSRQGLGNGQPL